MRFGPYMYIKKQNTYRNDIVTIMEIEYILTYLNPSKMLINEFVTIILIRCMFCS